MTLDCIYTRMSRFNLGGSSTTTGWTFSPKIHQVTPFFSFSVSPHIYYLLHATNPYLERMDELYSSDIIICRNSNGNFNVACYGRFLFYFDICLRAVADFSQIRNYT